MLQGRKETGGHDGRARPLPWQRQPQGTYGGRGPFLDVIRLLPGWAFLVYYHQNTCGQHARFIEGDFVKNDTFYTIS